MAERRLSVLIALSDTERADELAHALENDGLSVAMQSELEQPDGFDVVVTDAELLDGVAPHVLLGDAVPGANVYAVLPANADAALISATARIARAGYRLLPVEARPGDNLHPAGEHAAGGSLHAALTPRELETLTLLADGASNKVIARQLDISVHTAKFHVAAVLTKLQARNRADAVAIGLRHGLIYL
ncbi:helix-turn-helix transcriptional regulator [Mesorhizobium sp. ZC-5]|uniref:helix-turn-helix transcriptional regulator n=1 Tax=Mesorhizobium sp. ZC-5 TaxID=2986066 RepID=UPI0021E7D8B6|nr:LuxR C-terminal-related transcriptional regulator [Mesorhizobium sp. ZC-5]MCV3242970.1 LuxR C-terminal-related transcriptional regulator [Mesorhizobium sp. ZC-5]